MPVIDATTLPVPHVLETDVCIIGAGAAGLTLAGALRAGPRDVCVVEAGGFDPDVETQALHDLACVGYPLRENHMARARYYGGTCNLWAGRAMKLARCDIGARPWIGAPAWPMSHEELEGFYARAARVLHLPTPRPGRGFDASSDEERALLGHETLAPNVALWAKKPLRFGREYRDLFRARRHTLLLNANATEILTDESGSRVAAIRARRLGGGDIELRARTFVLAAGGLENARLLLVSRGRRAQGLGNEHDLVGRFFMEHPRAVYGRVQLARPVRLPMILGSPVNEGKVQIGIALSEETQRREGLVNSYVTLERELSNVAQERYRTSIGVAKVLFRRGHAGGRFDLAAMRLSDIKDMVYLLTPKEIMPHAVYRAYVALRRRLRGDQTRGALTIINYCEQLPDPSSRVYLSEERDRLGMNKLALDWRVGEGERRSIVRLHQILDEQLRRTGLGVVESEPADVQRLSFTDASHHMGTTKMHDDPRHGVVDSHCRVHGVSNLYVAGSSVFPTCGNANPTWTIVALALRLADHLKSAPAAANRGTGT